MLLGIGALPQNVAEPSAERQDEAPPGAEDVAKPEVADAVDAERQDDIGEAPPMPPGAKDIVEVYSTQTTKLVFFFILNF